MFTINLEHWYFKNFSIEMLMKLCDFYSYVSYSDKNSAKAGKYFAYATLNSIFLSCEKELN